MVRGSTVDARFIYPGACIARRRNAAGKQGRSLGDGGYRWTSVKRFRDFSVAGSTRGTRNPPASCCCRTDTSICKAAYLIIHVQRTGLTRMELQELLLTLA